MRFCLMLGRGAWVPLLVTTAFAGEVYPHRVTSVVRTDSRSGKLVRSVVVSPRVVAEQRIPETVVAPRVVSSEPESPAETSAQPATIDEAVTRIAALHSLPAPLIHSVIKVERNYNPRAVSSKGAQGLMQLIPSTARRFGVGDVFNPVENIEGGTRYLKYLLDLYHNDYALALAAYNAGEGAVARYGGSVPPYKETQNYLNLVARQLRKSQAKATSETVRTAPAPAAKAAETPSGEPNHIQKIVERDGTVRFVTR